MAQAQRQSVSVGELKGLLEKRGVVLPAEKVAQLAQLAAVTPVRGAGQVKYGAHWSSTELIITGIDPTSCLTMPASYFFKGEFEECTMEPSEGLCVIVADAPKDSERVARFRVVGGKCLQFLDAAGAVLQEWLTPELAAGGAGSGPSSWLLPEA